MTFKDLHMIFLTFNICDGFSAIVNYVVLQSIMSTTEHVGLWDIYKKNVVIL